MLVWLPYQLRCKYFHAENALPMFCFSEEHPLSTLRVVNKLLEQYLDANLPQWFGDENLNNCLLPTIRTAIDGCKCNKDGYLVESAGGFTPIDVLL